MDPAIKIKGIGQVAIAVTDIKSATKFYRDISKLELLFEAPSGLAFFNCGGVRLMLTSLQGDEKDHHTSVIYPKSFKMQISEFKQDVRARRNLKLMVIP
ncbi:MAG TPA: hypothetical protein ENJ60_14875 [Aeromonadales bacterium]|nr:hypothetical protein [Aeromonadales bacterium]